MSALSCPFPIIVNNNTFNRQIMSNLFADISNDCVFTCFFQNVLFFIIIIFLRESVSLWYFLWSSFTFFLSCLYFFSLFSSVISGFLFLELWLNFRNGVGFFDDRDVLLFYVVLIVCLLYWGWLLIYICVCVVCVYGHKRAHVDKFDCLFASEYVFMYMCVCTRGYVSVRLLLLIVRVLSM